MSSYTDYFEELIKELANQNTLITLKNVDSPIGPTIKIGSKKYINLASNNYLGLANDKRLIKAAETAMKKYGLGPAAVRTISGTLTLHQNLDKSLAEFKKADDAITFQSGFVANLAVIPAVTKEGSIIFSDELNHASIIDGTRLSKAEVVRYKHNDVNDLESKIKSYPKNAFKLIVTDGVFSMDGDIAPLDELHKIAIKYNSMLMVDDAHGEGVLGKSGRGIVDHFGLHGKVDIEVGTLSKAFGVIGGFATGKKEIISWLKQRARPFLFSSAMTVPDTAASIEAIRILSGSDDLVVKLWENAKYFKSVLQNAGIDIGKSETPITPIMVGEEKIAHVFSKELFDKGVFVTPITYPTVALGKARLRAMISASHTTDLLDRAADTIIKTAKKLDVI
jgi:glycine C-acetyltransferase